MKEKPSNAFLSALKGMLLSLLKVLGILISWLFAAAGWLLTKAGKLLQRLILKQS